MTELVFNVVGERKYMLSEAKVARWKGKYHEYPDVHAGKIYWQDVFSYFILMYENMMITYVCDK